MDIKILSLQASDCSLIRLDDIVYSLVLKEVEWAEKTNNKVYKWSWVENANRTIKNKQSKDVLVYWEIITVQERYTL